MKKFSFFLLLFFVISSWTEPTYATTFSTVEECTNAAVGGTHKIPKPNGPGCTSDEIELGNICIGGACQYVCCVTQDAQDLIACTTAGGSYLGQCTLGMEISKIHGRGCCAASYTDSSCSAIGGKPTVGNCNSSQNETQIGRICPNPADQTNCPSACCRVGGADPNVTTPPSASFAYTPLEAIPGQRNSGDFPSYVRALYSFGILSVGIAGLLMVMVGGFYYVTSAGNSSQVEKGKEFIKDALIGIVVAFGSWLVLYIINPDLVNINLDSLRQLKMTAGGTTFGPTPPTGPLPPGVPAGSCGNMNPLDDAVSSQCGLASSALSSMLSCMKSAGDNGTITSITARNIGGNFEKSRNCCGDPSCTHADYSCHYGCNTSTPGMSHAIDYDIRGDETEAQLCAIADRVHACRGKSARGKIFGPKDITCPGGGIITRPRTGGHDGHLHISTSECNG